MKQSYPRLRRVRFKNGTELEVLRPERLKHAERVRRGIEMVMEEAGDEAAGMAVVVWTANGTSMAKIVVTSASPLLSAAVPTFARERLLLWLAETWTRDGLRDAGLI